MNDDRVKPAGEKLPYREWIRTRCPLPRCHHFGPTADCLATLAELKALGPDAIQCPTCWKPTIKFVDCIRCGRPWPEEPKYRGILTGGKREPVGKYMPDGHGCVEKVSSVERAFLNGGEE